MENDAQSSPRLERAQAHHRERAQELRLGAEGGPARGSRTQSRPQVTDADWRNLAVEALQNCSFEIARKAFIRVRDIKSAAEQGQCSGVCYT